MILNGSSYSTFGLQVINNVRSFYDLNKGGDSIATFPFFRFKSGGEFKVCKDVNSNKGGGAWDC